MKSMKHEGIELLTTLSFRYVPPFARFVERFMVLHGAATSMGDRPDLSASDT